MLVGSSATQLTRDMWSHAYRGLDHGRIKNQCRRNLEVATATLSWTAPDRN